MHLSRSSLLSLNLIITWLYAVLASRHSAHMAETSPKGKVRQYFVAAVERRWDYAPSGVNQAKGVELEQDRWVCSYK